MLPGVNLNSGPQLKAALAERGVEVENVQEGTLKQVADGHPVVPLLLRRKDAQKRVSTYGRAYLEKVHPLTGRLHADFHQIGAASGRMSCSNPNLQNIPRGSRYRACVRPAAGRLLIKADYPQIELRIAARVSGDRAMLEAFQCGEDLHTRTARAVLGREPDKADRQVAKALNFGLIYGMGAPRLRGHARDKYGVKLTDAQAREFRARFFDAYKGLQRWHRQQAEGATETQTLTGRSRRNVEAFTEKLNPPVQGSGADMLKLALARLWEDRAAVPSAVPVLVVHDEIVLEVDAEEASTAAAWLREHMEAAAGEVLAGIPTIVEPVVTTDWSARVVLTQGHASAAVTEEEGDLAA